MTEESVFAILANTPELLLMALGLVLGYRVVDKALGLTADLVKLKYANKKVNLS